MATAYLKFGGETYTLPFAPDAVQFGYELKTKKERTLGGVVTQVLGMRVTDLAVSVSLGRSWETGYQKLHSFLVRGVSYCVESGNSMVFSYPLRGWSFKVTPKQIQPLSRKVEDVNLTMQIVFAIDETSLEVKEDVLVYELSKLKASYANLIKTQFNDVGESEGGLGDDGLSEDIRKKLYEIFFGPGSYEAIASTQNARG